MADWQTAVLTGLFVGIGSETAKVLHELYIKPRLVKMDERLKKIKKDGIEFEL